MKKYFIYTAIITATVTSCNLDTQPMSEIVSDELLSNPNSIITVTNGNYAILKGDADGGGFTIIFIVHQNMVQIMLH